MKNFLITYLKIGVNLYVGAAVLVFLVPFARKKVLPIIYEASCKQIVMQVAYAILFWPLNLWKSVFK